MKVKVKKLNEKAVIPTYAKSGDAGMDLVSTSIKFVTDDDSSADYIEYGTGLSFEIPQGYVGLIFPRSSNSKKDLTLCNSVGVIDSGYRGEVTLRYKIDATYSEAEIREDGIATCFGVEDYQFEQLIYKVGERVGQIIIFKHPIVEFEEVEELSESERGSNGYGSTGV